MIIKDELFQSISHEIWKKSPSERAEASNQKERWISEMYKKYGPDWKNIMKKNKYHN